MQYDVIILVLDFCPTEINIIRFPDGFHLKTVDELKRK